MNEQEYVEKAAGAAEAMQEAAEAMPPVDHDRPVERETGPLLPRWLTVTIWAIFLPWCVFAAVWIAWSMALQFKTQRALRLIGGPWNGEAPAMDSAAIREDLDVFNTSPRDSLLYMIQALRQEPWTDPRMADALALRRVVGWGTESRRRELFGALSANMNDQGELGPDFKLSEEQQEVLKDLIQERRKLERSSYEEQKINDVLQWVADGWPTPPTGTERRRVGSLQSGADKKLLHGPEASAIKAFARQWRASGDPLESSCAAKFELMLNREQTELSPQQSRLCEEVADKQEALYRLGCERLARTALDLIQLIHKQSAERMAAGKAPLRMDHPVIWDIARLLDYPYESVRGSFADGCFVLRRRKYVLIFLSEFIQRSTINPVMAVETTRLTREENIREVRAEMRRLRLSSISVVEAIGKSYYEKPFPILGIEPDQQASFVQQRVVGTVESVLGDEDSEVAARSQAALEAVQAVRQATQGAPAEQ